MAEGRFITFEGGEGAGKSTQVRLLEQDLRAAGCTVVVTREPGGSFGAEAIRALLVSGEVNRWDPWTEALLHSAARRDHLLRTVWPALEKGAWVLCDRFLDSTMAYQGYGHGLDPRGIEQLVCLVMGSFRPHLTLILDLPVEEGLRRAAGRGGGEDRYERMGLDFHRRLRQGFLEIARLEDRRCVVVDATRPADAVQAEVARLVRLRLGQPS